MKRSHRSFIRRVARAFTAGAVVAALALVVAWCMYLIPRGTLQSLTSALPRPSLVAGSGSLVQTLQLLVCLAGLVPLFWGVAKYAHFVEHQGGIKQYQAWQTIMNAQGRPGNGGRQAALEDLFDGGASIAGVNLAGGAYLAGLDLPGANLWGANLAHAVLWDANFDQTILQDADLEGCNLQDAILTGANLAGANLSGANLQDADLTGANLEDANLTGANLAGANFADANLKGAKLRLANLQGANLENASPVGADFKGANMTEVLGWTGSVA